MTFSSASYSPPPPTKAERREAARTRARRVRKSVGEMCETAKVERLASAIVDAWFARQGDVELRDLTQAGFSETEAKLLWDRAFARAQQKEPRIGAAS